MPSSATPEQASETLAGWFAAARPCLEDAGFSPRDAEHLAAHVLGRGWGDLWGRLREPLSDDAVSRLDALLGRRLRGEPLAYVIGTQPFRRLELVCGPGVLVPRPETEAVVDVALDLIDRLQKGECRRPRILDVGTGTGAIALAIADERPGASVWATEVSDEALGYARRNVERAGLDVRLVHGDLFEGLPRDLRGRIDLVVSNPPYVDPAKPELLGSDVAAEPDVALYGGEGGDEVLERLVGEVGAWLRPGGALVLEVGTGAQLERMRRRLEGWREGGVREDHAGRPRVLWVRT